MECVVLVHGFGRTGKYMKYLSKGIAKSGADTITPTVPTAVCSVDTCAVLLNDKIRGEIEKYEKVHFVGYSMGGLIIRRYLQEYNPPNSGRCVFIATPHLGTELANIAGNLPLAADFLNSIKDLRKSENNKYVLSREQEIGLIIGKKTAGLGKVVFDSLNDGLVEVESALSEDAKDVRVLNYTHHEICHKARTIGLVKSFIRDGVFKDRADGPSLSEERSPTDEESAAAGLLKKGLKLLSMGETLPAMPNIAFQTMGPQVFWDELANVNNWRVQQNMITRHCRVLDPDGARIAWGGVEATMRAFERLVEK
ncbi:MAG: alpha/beta fold hydrolase [Peptococcaceae bacterium]|jgi:hypothetical protein|nr:alpha/beta fold hydrolase [Peptococcaceae bacterium]